MKWEREDIFKMITGDESLHEVSNENGVRIVNFATSNKLSKAQHFQTATLINVIGILLILSHKIR
jgi:hypothetical protein